MRLPVIVFKLAGTWKSKATGRDIILVELVLVGADAGGRKYALPEVVQAIWAAPLRLVRGLSCPIALIAWRCRLIAHLASVGV
jgi:hypothetical protein